MSFMGSLSSYITPAVQAAGGIEQGKAIAKQQQVAQALLAAKEKRQSALDVLNARNINSEIDAREKPKGGALISQAGDIYERMPDGSYQKANIKDAPGAPPAMPMAGAPPAAAPPLPSSPSNGPTSPSMAPAAAPSPFGDVGAGSSSATPKFGPRPPHDPNSPESLKADSIRSAINAKNQTKFGPPGFSPVVITDPTGAQHVAAFGTKTGQINDTGVNAKAATGGGIGSLSPSALQAMYDQASHADAEMRAYENDYRAGKVSVNAGSQTLGAGAGAHSTGIGAILSGAEAAGSNAVLGVTDKRYQTYLAAQKRFGNIMGNLMSKRYSEYQGTLDTQLAGLATQDAIPTLDLKQSYRSDLLKNRPPRTGVAPTAQTGGPSGDINLSGKAQQVRAAKAGDPTAGMADADAWEYWKSAGLTPAQATAKVQSRKK
jgi:hypothetical protein